MSERTYAGSELADRLAALPGWTESESAIRREFATDGWSTTLMLVNLIGFLCEAADHHPDLKVSWGKVEVRLNTHTAGGVTDKDLELAQVIERQATWKPAGGALSGTRRKWISS